MQTEINTILSTIKDKYLNLTAEQMGLEWAITEKDQTLTLTFKAGFPTTLLHESFIPHVLEALQSVFPQHTINIYTMPLIKAHNTQLPGKALRGVKNTIAIASGKGGVGKSTVTVNLAIALANMGARVGILDADIYGPSMPLMLGKSEQPEIFDDKYLPIKAHGVSTMSIGYLAQKEQALIWRGPMLAKSLLQMLDITLWDDLDYLFIDLPPGTGDIQLSLVQKIPLAGAIVVTTPQQVATLDADKAITLFRKTNIDVLGLVENMALHICSHCNHVENIFGSGGAKELCDKNDCLLLGELPLNKQIRENCDDGTPTASFKEDPLSLPFKLAALKMTLVLSMKPLS